MNASWLALALSKTTAASSVCGAAALTERRRKRGRRSIGLAVIAVYSIPALGLAEVIPVAMAKRDPDAPTAEPNDVMANRIPACSPVEGCGSAER